MKNKLKRISRFALVALLGVMMLVLSGCTAVQISATLNLNEDGTGSRTITASIAKNDYQDGYGSAYYYFKKHGAELEEFLKTTYTTAVPGSENWLNITVDDSGADWELVHMTFDFTSFDDYKEKLAALAYDETQKAAFIAPELTSAEDGSVTYTENTAALTTIFKSMQTTIMADESIFDINSTKDGQALNDGSSDLQSLIDYGAELMKPDYGNALTIKVGSGEATPVVAENGVFTYTANYGGGAVAEVERVRSNVLNYGFNGDLANKGTAAESDLIYGPGSPDGGPVFVEGIDGQAIQLDGKTYLASPNKTFAYDEMTISFYYKMAAYTETDTGANMIVVPAGLGALGAGVIDIEFIKDGDVEGVQLLAKMNSADWQTQDKLYSEGYFVETHLDEWHNYTLVFQNEYDEFGNINDAFVFMYIDGKLVTKARLSVAAGLTYSLGSYDDGSFGEPNGGFNVGGYFENGEVKRAATGLLDNFLIFDGALSEEEVNTLAYTTAVSAPYDPSVVDEVGVEEPVTEAPTAAPTEAPAEVESSESNTALIVVIVIVIAAAAVAAVLYLKKKKK